jgi:hypothetical protein
MNGMEWEKARISGYRKYVSLKIKVTIFERFVRNAVSASASLSEAFYIKS